MLACRPSERSARLPVAQPRHTPQHLKSARGTIEHLPWKRWQQVLLLQVKRVGGWETAPRRWSSCCGEADVIAAVASKPSLLQQCEKPALPQSPLSPTRAKSRNHSVSAARIKQLAHHSACHRDVLTHTVLGLSQVPRRRNRFKFIGLRLSQRVHLN